MLQAPRHGISAAQMIPPFLTKPIGVSVDRSSGQMCPSGFSSCAPAPELMVGKHTLDSFTADGLVPCGFMTLPGAQSRWACQIGACNTCGSRTREVRKMSLFAFLQTP